MVHLLITILLVFGSNSIVYSNGVDVSFSPNAKDDYILTQQNQSITISPASNDFDEAEDLSNCLTELISEPLHGNVELLDNGTDCFYQYIPNTDFTGMDTLGYIICNSEGLCDEAQIFITVNPCPEIHILIPRMICAGETLNLATNSSVFGTFQWFKDDRPLSDAPVFDITSVTEADEGRYTITIVDEGGCISRQELYVEVEPCNYIPTEVPPAGGEDFGMPLEGCCCCETINSCEDGFDYLQDLFPFMPPPAQVQRLNRSPKRTQPNIPGPAIANCWTNAYTGNFFLRIPAFHFGGFGPPLQFDLFYNSGNTALRHGYGNGWSHTYNLQWQREGDDILSHRADGQVDRFAFDGGGYVSSAGIADTLVAIGVDAFTLTTKQGATYFFADSDHQRLTRIEDPFGNALTIDYTAGLPTSITDMGGRQLNLTYNNGLLSTVTDAENRSYQVTYSPDGQGNNSLVQITNPQGNHWDFRYDRELKLTQINNLRGMTADITYNDNRAVARMQSAISDISVEYLMSSAETVVREQVGTAQQGSTYTFDIQGRVVQIAGNCCGYDRQFTYDDDNNITAITNALGGQSRMTYDERGNVTSLTDPMGQTAEYSYESRYNQLAYSKDRNGNISTCDFNADSRLVAIHLPHQVTETFSYTQEGQLQSMTNGNGNITSYEYNDYGDLTIVWKPWFREQFAYDDRGNQLWSIAARGDSTHYQYDDLDQLVAIRDALGFSIRYTLDENGNQIAMQDKRGYMTNQAYDAHDRMTEMENPLGEITHYEYDAKDNRTKMTDAEGQQSIYIYNTNNQLVSRTDAEGNTWEMAYDAAGNKIKETDPSGHEMHFVYDQFGRMNSQTTAGGETINYEYDANGNNTAMVVANGLRISMEYDSLNRLVRKVYPAYTLTYEYDANGNMTRFTDGKGQSTRYRYDANDRQIAMTTPLGFAAITDYDENDNVTNQRDLNGNGSQTTYDILNRPMVQFNALSEVISRTTYNAEGQPEMTTNMHGEVTNYHYDDKGQLLRMVNALGTTTYTYDGNGNRTSMTDALPRTVRYTYDELDRKIRTLFPDGTITETEYDDRGNVRKFINENGDETTFSYNELNQQIGQTNAEGESTSRQFSEEGLLLRTTLPNSNVIHNVYDAQRRLISQYDNNGTLFIRTYDSNGNIIRESDGNGLVTNMVYDANDRLVEVIDPDQQSTRFAYDNNGNRTMITDREGKITRFVYDQLNRLISQTDALGNTTTFTYDVAGNQLSVTDANGNTTSYTYDSFNRLTTETFADRTNKTYTYDSIGRLTSRTDNNGDLTQYNYDIRDRLILRDYPGNDFDASFDYDAAGRLVSAQNSFATVNLALDKIGRTLSETLNGEVLGYAYDVANNTRTITYPSGRRVEEQQNVRGQVVTIENNDSFLADFNYDSGSRLMQRNLANETETSFAYSANNWATEIRHQNQTANFAHYRYALDKEGNKQQAEKLHRPTHSEHYQYDNNYRLTDFDVQDTQSSPAVQATDFAYDALGNRTTMLDNGTSTSYRVNDMHEYTAISGQNAPIYDDNGNLLSNDNYSFQYDYENRLISVDNGSVATYQYDALGRRIRKITPVEDTRYYYDGARVIEEHDQNGNLQAEYIYGNWIDDILWMKRYSNAYFYHQNALGSVMALTDAQGEVVEYYEYDAYGQPTILSSSFGPLSSSISGNPYLFTGRRWDEETDLYYYRARYYDTETGRFLQRDPLGYVDGWNMYEYVGGNPVMKMDPLGLKKKKFFFTKKGWSEVGARSKEIRLANEDGFDVALEYENLSEIIAKIETNLKRPIDQLKGECQDCIKVLEISAHGCSGQVNIGGKKFSESEAVFDFLHVNSRGRLIIPTDTKRGEEGTGELFLRIRQYMCVDGRVAFAACSSFKGVKGDFFGEMLADIFGVPVTGARWDINSNQTPFYKAWWGVKTINPSPEFEILNHDFLNLGRFVFADEDAPREIMKLINQCKKGERQSRLNQWLAEQGRLMSQPYFWSR